MLGSLLGKPTRCCLKKETCCCRFVSDKSLPILITEERHDGFAFWNISDLSSMNVSGPPFVTIFWKKIGVVLSNDLMKITNGKKVNNYMLRLYKHQSCVWVHVHVRVFAMCTTLLQCSQNGHYCCSWKFQFNFMLSLSLWSFPAAPSQNFCAMIMTRKFLRP